MALFEDCDLIAPDLVSIVSNFAYRRYIQYMPSDEAITEEMYQQMELNNMHWIEKRSCHKSDGSRNVSAIFELFGSFSNEISDQVRANMIQHVEHEGKLYKSVGQIVLGMRQIGLESWCNEMRDSNQFPDELTIYALSRTYNRHKLVLCHKRFWTTLEAKAPMPEMELFQACHVHLAYLGCGLFGQLKIKPYESEIPNPRILENLSLLLSISKSRGGSRKPLNLSVSNKVLRTDNTTDDGPNVVENSSNTSEALHDHTYTGLSQPKSASTLDTSTTPEIKPDNPTTNKTQHSQPGSSSIAAVTIDTPAVNIPEHLYLHPILQEKYYGEQRDPNMKGGNDEAVNAKGRNDLSPAAPTESIDELSTAAPEDPIGEIEKALLSSVTNRKCYIPLERLHVDVIKAFCPSQQSPLIDPYSSLEDIGTKNDSDSDSEPGKQWRKTCEQQAVEELNLYPLVIHSHTSYFMRARHNKRTLSSRPQRKCANVNYADLGGPDSEEDPPKKKLSKPRVKTEPSKDRIAAQEDIIACGKPKHKPPAPVLSTAGKKHFFRKDPNRAKPPHRKPIPIKNDPENNILDSQNGAKTNHGQPKDAAPVPKGSFKTEEHGLKRYKEVRYFKCPKCGIHKTTVMKLNDHYKHRHPPIKCDKCIMVFSTPSGLSRHQYVHSTPRYPCLDCEKSFHFSSELKTHRVVHLKVKAHFCNHGNCERGFMNKSDLYKHVREHDAKELSCDSCDYTTKNPRLLKSHQLVHTNVKPYSCCYCLEKFKYRTQLHRHKETCKKKPSRSASLDY